ncbi:MAG: hypothetical protein ABJE95_09870 [Byssovorax sp.]
MLLVTAWLKAFLLTVVVETPIAAALFRSAEPRLSRRVALVLLANLASHPAVWFIFPELGLPYFPALLLAETWAVLLEAGFYRLTFEKSDAVESLGISALANGASLGLGLLVRAATGWV